MGRPTHRKPGAKLGYPTHVVDVLLLCESCGARQQEAIARGERVESACAETTCVWCGRLGVMRPARAS